MGSKYGGNTEFYRKATNQKLTLPDVFSDMFKKHAKGDGEMLFTSGTSTTTPNPSDMIRAWKKPWVFLRVFGFGMFFILLLTVMTIMGYGVYAMVPLVFIGAFIMPLSVLIFYLEMNIPRNIPLYEVGQMLIIGGIISLIFTGFFNMAMSANSPAYMAPITEEPAKLLALCLFLRKPNRRYILNGIVIGGAVGAGFAAIETCGYALNYGTSLVILRGLTAPGGHVLWAAIYGGGLALVAGNEKLSPKHFLNFEFLKYFFTSCILHCIWNMDFGLFPLPFVGDVKYIILTIVGWIMLLSVISKGINQALQVAENAPASVAARATVPAMSPGMPVASSAVNGRSCMLYCVSGEYAGQSIPLSGGKVVIGRDSSSCNLLFPPKVAGISRNHCTVTADDSGVYLCDNGSSYGTFLDSGAKLTADSRVTLTPGQRFYLANSQTTFEVRK